MRRFAALASLGLATMALASPAAAATPTGCGYSVCEVHLTAAQLLTKVEDLVRTRQFDAAAPLLTALAQAPQYDLQTGFLRGYVAVETGDIKGAIKHFRDVLIKHPEQTRVRLELARALLLIGKDAAAEHHFRLAAQDKNLPPEIAATIRTSRGLLRDRRAWSFSFDFGLAPDTNINNGTTVETIDANLGGTVIPLTLSNQQRAQTGIGENVSTSGTLRLPLAKKTKLLIEGDANFTRYDNSAFNDLTVQMAAGPEFRLSDRSSLAVEGVGNEHLYGGVSAATAFGARATYQRNLEGGQRVGLTFDARHTASGFSSGYSGWQFASYLSYERVVMRSLIASASLFARRDALNDPSYASRELGVNIGIGGELAHGINAGLSGGVSRAEYDAPLKLLSSDPRHDWRFNARLYVGLRSVRVLGFSPSVTFSYNRNASNISLYDSQRSRVRFGLMRYF